MVAATTVAAVIDLRSRRIPNAICGALAAVALAAHAFAGPRSFADAALALLLVLAVGLPVHTAGWFGGGDLKLFAACAGAVGLHELSTFTVAVFVAGGALSVVEAVRRRRLRAVLVSTFRTGLGFGPSERLRVPYGVAIAAAALWYSINLLSVNPLRWS
jgi:Flp pilus assembly protein protease CpaA